MSSSSSTYSPLIIKIIWISGAEQVVGSSLVGRSWHLTILIFMLQAEPVGGVSFNSNWYFTLL